MDEADKAAIAAALQDSWSLLGLLSPFFCFAVWICFLLVLNHFWAFGASISIDMKTKKQMNVIWDAPDMYDIRMART